MPGLIATREEFAASQPLKGARITGSLHMTVQTAVLIETLTALGAEVRWARATSSRPRITPPRRSWSARTGRRRTPRGAGVRVEGRDARGVLVVHRPGADVAGEDGPNMILDDGGDATLLVHNGVEYEARRRGAGRVER